MANITKILFCCLAWAGIFVVGAADVKCHSTADASVNAVYDLVKRILPNSDAPFEFGLRDCQNNHGGYFELQSTANHKILVSASTVSDLTAGVGYYLREHCNMTFGWPRGGGSQIIIPKKWPMLKSKTTKKRLVPWSYLMNVCTHSYSLVWYDWSDWEIFIDWMALRGINLMLALTGQEQVQYKVFRKLGLTDLQIRTWFNGPAFLTWSRGQNEYGSNIAGPLPKSWMKAQWEMQRNQILPRLRSLGIVGQLPGFQGNVPIQVKHLFKDANITQEGDTGWIDALDPLYGKIADLWMQQLIADFGTDHWYQLDGYFNGGTAPWLSSERKGHDLDWFHRGVQAYTGLNRTDPDAIWSYQGFAFVGWSSDKEASNLKGFVDAAPPNKFVIIDMSYSDGEWTKWNNASFFGAPYILTALHNFGGTDGIKGDLRRINQFPFESLQAKSSITGIGATPEGIDQNPAYYDFLFEQNYRMEPHQDLAKHMVRRAHKRYGLKEPSEHVAQAWKLLVDSLYSNDLSVQDHTGIAHLSPPGGDGSSLFLRNRYTPSDSMCKIFNAWTHLIALASKFADNAIPQTLEYDLVNQGREVMAQLSTPAALNFSEATSKVPLDLTELHRTGNFLIRLLNATDLLVGTNVAFLLGPWIHHARKLGKTTNDCHSTMLNTSQCSDFYEWNARTQITTWNPTAKNSPSIPGGPIDYAAKHWNGLIRDYYGNRASVVLRQALSDACEDQAINQTILSRLLAKHAYEWTTDTKKYPEETTGSALDVSVQLHAKYTHWFTSCYEIAMEPIIDYGQLSDRDIM